MLSAGEAASIEGRLISYIQKMNFHIYLNPSADSVYFLLKSAELWALVSDIRDAAKALNVSSRDNVSRVSEACDSGERRRFLSSDSIFANLRIVSM